MPPSRSASTPAASAASARAAARERARAAAQTQSDPTTRTRAAAQTQSDPTTRTRATAGPRPRRASNATPAPTQRSRVRWDRKFRTVMLCVLALVGYIGLKAMLALVDTHTQAQQELTLVSSLQRQHEALQRRQHQLNQRSTIIREARALGMVRAGEKPYVVTGLHGGR